MRILVLVVCVYLFSAHNNFSQGQQSESSDEFNTDFKSISFKNVLNQVPYSQAELNFLPNGTGTYAGDLNGDGLDDFISVYSNIQDERTGVTGDNTNKSLIFFGGNSSAVDYDQLFYTDLRPVGDLNNDGFDDAVAVEDSDWHIYLGSTNGIAKSEEAFPFTLSPEITGFLDFDQDGFDDILSFEPDRTDGYTIVFGASTIAGFSAESYDATSSSAFIVPAVLQTPVILEVYYTNFNINGRAKSINSADRTVEDVTLLSASFLGTGHFPSSFGEEMYAADLNGDGNDELIQTFTLPGSQLYRGATHVTDFFKQGTNKVTLFFDPEDNKAVNIKPLGDFNGDGKVDLYSNSGDEITIMLGQESIFDIVETAVIDPSSGLDYNYSQTQVGSNRSNRQLKIGDFDGDGFDDLTVVVTTDTELSKRIYQGNDSNDFTQYLENTSSRQGLGGNWQHLENVNLGDLNDDGYDDLGILFQSKLAIYFGGSFKTEPDIELQSLAWLNADMDIADLNGDGKQDLIISQKSGPGNSSTPPRISIHYWNEGFNQEADLFISATDFSQLPGNNESIGVSNIGDYNNDGFDDLAVQTRPFEFYILYGGTTLTNAPDVVMKTSLQSDFGIDGLSTFSLSVATRIMPVSDINGDNINDFVVADLGRTYSLPGEGTSFSQGALLVFYGSTHEPGASQDITPNQVLALTEDRYQGFIFFGISMTSGDYNGDGEQDILATSFDITSPDDESSDPNGSDGFLIYYGGAEFDSEPDVHFGLPGAPFNNDQIDKINRVRGELLTVDDLNGDGADEIIYGSYNFGINSSISHAVMLMGGEQLIEANIPAVQFLAPNDNTGLSTTALNLRVWLHSTIGDFDGDGIAEIVIPQAEDRNYSTIPIYTFPLEDPARLSQEISFSVEQLAFQNTPITLNPEASSGLPVTVEVLEGPATIDGLELSLTGRGVVTLKASQVGNDTYNPAPLVTISFEVVKGDQTITFAVIEEKSTADEPFELSASSDSGLEVVFELVSGPAQITGNLVTLTGETGEVEITASQQGDDNFNAASTVTRSFNVSLVTSAEELALRRDIKIYPVPSRDKLYIDLNNASFHQFKSIRLVNSQGEINLEKTIALNLESEITLDLSSIPAGIYILEILSHKGVFNQKIIKQ